MCQLACEGWDCEGWSELGKDVQAGRSCFSVLGKEESGVFSGQKGGNRGQRGHVGGQRPC